MMAFYFGLFGILGILLAYYIFRSLMQMIIDGKLSRYFLIASILFLTIIALSWYFMRGDEPESFKNGTELVLKNYKLFGNIGRYDGYSYNTHKLPKETDNPAIFNLELNGSAATKYLTCTIQKDNAGVWVLRKITIDSLVKKAH